MTKEDLLGLVILMKADKSLLQTRKIRIYQRENLVDALSFLIPISYEFINADDSGFDLQNFTVMMNYLDQSGTVHTETLQRYSHTDPSTGIVEYEDYIDKAGNHTHMIYRLPVDSRLTDVCGEYTVNLRLQYVDYAAQTLDSFTEPEPKLYQMSTGNTTIKVLPIADYYSVVSTDTFGSLLQEIAALKNRSEILEARADSQEDELEDTKANMVNDITLSEDKLYLQNSKNEQVGTEIEVNDLGDAVAEYTTKGLVKVITDDDESGS